MNATLRDRITGLVLLAVGLVWSGLVYQLIPAGDGAGGAIGPRAFPLMLGLILVGLSAAMVIRTFVIAEPGAGARQASGDAPISRLELAMAGGIFATIILYGVLMQKLGFRIATFVVTAGVLVVLLKVRRPLLVLVFSACVSLLCWAIFNKLLGAYLPTGTWTSLG